MPPSGRTMPQTIFSSYPSYILVFRSTFFSSFFFLFIYSGLCRTCGSTSWFPLPLGKSLPFLCSRPTGSGTGGTSRFPPCGGSAPQGRTSFPIPKKGRPESPETARPPPYFTLFIHLLQDAFIGPHPESVSPKAKYGFPLRCIGSTGRHSAYLRQALRRNRCFSGPSR